jgi:SAM-dependent methyltransferase
MQMNDSPPTNGSNVESKTLSLADWLATPLGAYTLARERAWLDTVTPDIFGYHAVQLGLPAYDLLRESRIANRVVISPEAATGATLVAQFHALPIESQSVDLCLLPHTLEFATAPHDILREVDRIMRPEGRILIAGFNPWSLYGMKRLWSSEEMPWNGQFVSLIRMKDWLSLLSFEATQGTLTCYIPPIQSAAWQSRLGFVERAGQRWWGVAGGVYLLEAVKRVEGMRLIAPVWSKKAAKERKYAAAAHKATPNNHLKVIK